MFKWELARWQQRARQLKTEIIALALAYRDPRTPWFARVWTALVVAYALSPLDLIPDPIPVLGYLDDLVLLPLGIVVALRLIPPDVMTEARTRAATVAERPVNWIAAGCMVAVWIALGIAILALLR